MEEQKNDVQVKKHSADCGCEVCYRTKRNGRIQKIAITTGVLLVVFVAGIIVGRTTGGGKNFNGQRGMGNRNFPGGTMMNGNFQTGRTGARNNSDIQMENQTAPSTAAPQDGQVQAGSAPAQTTDANTAGQPTAQPAAAAQPVQ